MVPMPLSRRLLTIPVLICYDNQVMIERDPDFEDEKIRIWSAREEDQRVRKFEGDPTMLSLDIENEEIFESRTYRFRQGPGVLLYLIDLLVSRCHQGKLELDPEKAPETAAELMEETTFKFLAKRRKEDGSIRSLLVAITADRRTLLAGQEWVGETEYRQAVEEFEANFLPKGILNPPLVVALEEWRHYSRQGPISEEG